MAVIKTSLLLLVVACALIASTEATNNWVRVPPCDEVCNRSDPEKNECCRAHGQGPYATCYGGMNCYQP